MQNVIAQKSSLMLCDFASVLSSSSNKVCNKPAKRKNQLQTGGKDHKRRKVSAIGGEVSHQQTSFALPTDGEGMYNVPDNGNPAIGGEASLQQTSFTVHTDGKDTKTPECEEPAERNLTKLRRRMEAEKARVIEYINDKRDSEILIDAASLWRRAEDDKAREENQYRRLETIKQEKCLLGWTTWWTRMEDEASASKRMDRKRDADRKKTPFKNNKIPNLTLAGWMGWWQRMEAENRKEQTKLRDYEEWKKAKSINNKEIK